MSIVDVVLGRRLASSEQDARKIGWFEGVPAMGLDGLGSASYGPEAALTILIPLGVVSLDWIGPVMAPIVLLLVVLYLSYRQTVVAYPTNGGAYTVSKENLGRDASLVAAAAIMIDYVLNVAVGISAGVGALTSSVPALQPYTLALCLAVLALVTLANLRGTAEAGWLFAVPTGVGAFREPVVRNAHRTLTVICAALGLLLVGIAAVAHAYALGAMDQTQPDYQSVLSQLAGAVAGRGAIYYVAMASMLAVLCLSANTSFVGFPRLCRLVAEDGFLPRSFAVADRRLVFSVGIAFLTVVAGLLLVAFGGITDRLIPLFAVGAFLTFTMSQAGMVVHWRRQSGRNGLRLAINALGAATTLAALGVIVVAKFTDGAWIVLLALPATVWLLRAIHRYYAALDARLAVAGPFTMDETAPPTVLVAVQGRNRLSDRALQFAMTLSPDVIAVHLVRLQGPEAEDDAREVEARWRDEVVDPLAARGLKAPKLVLLAAPFREIHGPLLDYMERLDAETPGRSVAVLIPELVLTRWWERLLHNRRGERLRAALLQHGGPRLNVIISPWRS